jgi:hypothetical protein
MFSFGSLVGLGQFRFWYVQFSYVEAGTLVQVLLRLVASRSVQFWQVSWGKVS